MTAVSKCPAQSPLRDVMQRFWSLLEHTYSLTDFYTFFRFGSDDKITFQADSMDADIFYYLQTLLTPLLALTLSLCILRYCCKFCRKVSVTDSDLDLSNSNRIYVIPNPIHVREERDERDETDSHEDLEYIPPPYELVCPPPSYAEANFKLHISDVQVTPDSEMPPPYSPPLPSQSSSHQQQTG